MIESVIENTTDILLAIGAVGSVTFWVALLVVVYLVIREGRHNG